MISRIRDGLINRLAPLVLGRHPHNLIFSFNYFNVAHLRRFLTARAQRLPEGERVFLDVGAGQSPYREFFTGKYSRYIALDVPMTSPIQPIPAMERIAGTAERIPLPDASIDVVLFNQVLEHVVDPDASLCEIRRVLKPGGLIFGSVPHVSPVHLEPHDFRRYTDLGLSQILEKQGYTQIELEMSGSVYSSTALLLTMDWVLSRRQPNRPQQFLTGRALLLSPLVGFINAAALLCETVLPNSGRSAANLCWSAIKQS